MIKRAGPFQGGDKMRYAIEIDRLKKSYGDHTVLKRPDVWRQGRRDICRAWVNGAGKTTALECIEGIAQV